MFVSVYKLALMSLRKKHPYVHEWWWDDGYVDVDDNGKNNNNAFVAILKYCLQKISDEFWAYVGINRMNAMMMMVW